MPPWQHKMLECVVKAADAQSQSSGTSYNGCPKTCPKSCSVRVTRLQSLQRFFKRTFLLLISLQREAVEVLDPVQTWLAWLGWHHNPDLKKTCRDCGRPPWPLLLQPALWFAGGSCGFKQASKAKSKNRLRPRPERSVLHSSVLPAVLCRVQVEEEKNSVGADSQHHWLAGHCAKQVSCKCTNFSVPSSTLFWAACRECFRGSLLVSRDVAVD
ncbi:unnamed protein product [Symbiodinium natans]|uniref:Uncharacterized protein n=1 Tax=Symbiodinium natans TaxID=878477 RepID=A0A812SL28_9DINO|nr:unnamed protein product [Symbiodinium natans]